MTITAAQKAVFRLPRWWMGDTAAAHCRVILTVFGGLAEFDRDLIHTHTGERRGQARGVKLGRKPKLTEDQRREALRRRDGARDARATISVTAQFQGSQPERWSQIHQSWVPRPGSPLRAAYHKMPRILA